MSSDGPLLKGIDLTSLVKPPKETPLGLPKAMFGKHPLGQPADEYSLILPLNRVTEIRLPARLFRDRQFVVDGQLDISIAISRRRQTRPFFQCRNGRHSSVTEKLSQCNSGGTGIHCDESR